MFQQQGMRWLQPLRAPGVGIGVLGIGIACAALAAAIGISLVVGSRATPASRSGIGAAAPGAPAHHSGLNVEDFGTNPRVAPIVAAPAAQPWLNVQDFGATPVVGRRILSQAPPQATVVAAPAHLSRELLVGDFAPAAAIAAAAPAHLSRELLVDDFGH